MCARRFLMLVAFLTLLAVLASFAFFQWGDRVLRDQAMPTVEFVEPEPEPEGRFADASMWLLRPGIEAPELEFEPEFEATPLPEPVIEDAMVPPPPPPLVKMPPVPTFYVHPTTYLKRDRWNAPVELEGQEAHRTKLFVRSQASIFAETGPVWAPRYRQAAFGAFLSREDDALSALEVAYRDVVEAFDQFLLENPEGPIVLAGHSQGALHLLHLLSDRGNEIADRLVVAYVVGWPIDSEADLPATGLPVCKGPEATGCIMSWMSFGDPPNASLVLRDWAKGDGYAEINRNRDRLVCTNPVTGGAANEAAAADHRGALIPTTDFTGGTLIPGQFAARCENGLLLIDGETEGYGRFVLPGNNFHVFDFALFWAPVREDVRGRVLAWDWGE
ncbi:DUF3089 domain-containing protein [Sphingomicrobium clamense]|uniref:DUF3089 domain-containing protein n=1 Tax=Sphingomicrobium clamense TaxID=2851013 RepID=A0ABS6V6R9_9SPHN|nr:DUF3089 domain-containing protein [Sphingomicrobium sp. B8]MBW0145260.1 DUF3089 domain-containing protein [Sphingomicrobium sp. B8]